MAKPTQLYHQSLALLTDLYQLTMAQGYWKTGLDQHEAVFDLYFRKHPFQGGFSIACGLGYVCDLLEGFRFVEDDIAYLAGLTGNDGHALFEAEFLDMLAGLEFNCDVDAIPEGTVVFPQEPLVRVKGPIIQCQIVETVLLNSINCQTLIATKAARVSLAAAGDPILEFGLRRAHGIDGALAVSRAAHIGGCAATSNVLAGKLFDIPVRGTHAHSWVMSFDDELSSFKAYAQAMPNNCVFLVDTFDSLSGVRNAVEVGKWLREQGHDLAGIRLDSGDLAYLSIEARKILDDAGFDKAVIVASNDLDEHIIASLKQQHAAIGVWGVGTRLVTAYDQPAMGGVYKLTALRPPGGAWRYKLKLSEQALKISNPGIHQVRRFQQDGQFVADAIYEIDHPATREWTIIDPVDVTRRKRLLSDAAAQDLLVPVFRAGQRVWSTPHIAEIRAHALDQLSRFHDGIKRFVNPHQYPVGLEKSLHDLKMKLVMQARGLD